MQPKQKKVPLRMCTGCGQMKPKKEMLRVVRDKEGAISLDFKGKKPGRGAYVCRSLECLKKSRKGRRLEKAFQCSIPDEIYQKLEEEFSQGEGE